jgi:hypothetical protein
LDQKATWMGKSCMGMAEAWFLDVLWWLFVDGVTMKNNLFVCDGDTMIIWLRWKSVEKGWHPKTIT